MSLNRRQFNVGIAALAAVGVSHAQPAAVNWRYFGVVPAGNAFGKKIEEGFKRIASRTNGRLNIQYVYFAETPYKFTDALNLMRNGLLEAVEFLPGYFTGTFPILAAPELPFLAPKSLEPAAAQKIADQAWGSGVMKSELQKVISNHSAVRLMDFYYPPMNHWSSKKIEKLSDLKGLKIRDFSRESMDLLRALGATPVTMDGSEIYSALQRGVVDGLVTGSTSLSGQKWGEVAKFGYITNFKLAYSTVLASKAAFDKLPDDVKTIATEEFERLGRETRELMSRIEPEQHELLKRDFGMTILKASVEDYTAAREIARAQVWPDWVKRTGGSAESVLKGILSAISG